MAAISGAVRLVKRSGRMQYPAAAAGFVLLIVRYQYSADERLALSLYPLALMGFWAEAKHFWKLMWASWDRQWITDRVAAALAAAVLAGTTVFIAIAYTVGGGVPSCPF